MVFSGLSMAKPPFARLERAAMWPWRSPFGAPISFRSVHAPWPAALDVGALPLLWTASAPSKQTIFALDRRASGGASARL
jgi:hypothetical protein